MERVLMSGNDAIGRGAILAGCKFFYGYPITPQSEIMEYVARELPKAGGVFLQAECELSTAGMVYGSAMTGARSMTASSGPGVSLMQEFVSFMSFAQVPAVIVVVTRYGPGTGLAQSTQTDYRQLTKGGGHGGYHCIVLAPWSPQECLEQVQLAFYLADKYRIVVYVLADANIGQIVEPVEARRLDLGPLPEKEWAVAGRDRRGGKPMPYAMPDFVGYHLKQNEKYKKIEETEVRYQTYKTDDMDLLIVAHGSVARWAQGAVDMAREQGYRVGLLRPITQWPFPSQAVREAALRAGKVLVVEKSSGLMVEDVEFAVLKQVPVHLLGIWGCHQAGAFPPIYAERIVEEVKKL